MSPVYLFHPRLAEESVDSCDMSTRSPSSRRVESTCTCGDTGLDHDVWIFVKTAEVSFKNKSRHKNGW